MPHLAAKLPKLCILACKQKHLSVSVTCLQVCHLSWTDCIIW